MRKRHCEYLDHRAVWGLPNHDYWDHGGAHSHNGWQYRISSISAIYNSLSSRLIIQIITHSQITTMGFTLVPVLAGLAAVANALPVAIPNPDGPTATITASWFDDKPTATITASWVDDEGPTATVTASEVEATGFYTATAIPSEVEATGFYTATVTASEVEATGYYTGYTGYSGYTATVEAVPEGTASVKYRFTLGGNIVLEQVEKE
ncbi:hypothetical protein DPSP01_007883 [Paraphaeosphaeria sporulosa]